MTSSTPNTPEPGPAKKPAPRKTTPRKPVAKAAAAKPKKADAQVTDAATTDVIATPEPEPAPVTENEPAPETAKEDAQAAHTAGVGTSATVNTPRNGALEAQSSGSILSRIRVNPVGPLMAGLLVAVGVGLLLSVLVPSNPNALALTILGLLLAAAVGFTVRHLSILRNLSRQIEALIVTAIGVHVMAVTGAVNMDLPLLAQFGVSGPGFNEALLAALATPPVATGGLIAGVVAAIIVGWGRREL